MDYLKILRENPDLADEFDSLFDFFLLDELSPRDDAEGRCSFSLPGMAFARDGSGGEYHLLEDGSIGYYSSEGEAGRLAESMDHIFIPFSNEGDVKIYSQNEIVNFLTNCKFKNIKYQKVNNSSYLVTAKKQQ